MALEPYELASALAASFAPIENESRKLKMIVKINQT